MGQYVEQGYQFDLTAPQINDVLLMARNFSRPNLLHNSRLSINQRNRTFPLTSVSGDPSNGEISATDFLVDRWHVYGTGTVYTKTNLGDNNVVMKVVTHDANGDVANLLALRQFMWTPDTYIRGYGTNILFDKDVTISILYEDGHLFTSTGHTPKWSDFNSATNGDVGTDIRAIDNNDVCIRLGCNKNSVSSTNFEAAFMFEIFGRDSGIIAAKVEIGVGQTLAIKVGGKWELIDHYDVNEDLKICQRFYRFCCAQMMPTLIDTLADDKYRMMIILPTVGDMMCMMGNTPTAPSIDMKYSTNVLYVGVIDITHAGGVQNVDKYFKIINDDRTLVDGATLQITRNRVCTVVGGAAKDGTQFDRIPFCIVLSFACDSDDTDYMYSGRIGIVHCGHSGNHGMYGFPNPVFALSCEI